MKCCECGRTLDTLRNCAFEITGWEQPRKDGGTNHVIERKRTGNILCPVCIQRLLAGVSPHQEALV